MTAPTPIDADLLRGLPLPEPKAGSKDERGRVMLVGGSTEVPGAALLAGIAALRAGAGKLQIATVTSVAPHLAMAIPEALVLAMTETQAGGIAPDAARLLERAGRCDALLVGPGMVEDEDTDRLVADLLAGLSAQKMVLDAAPLSNLSRHRDLLLATAERAVITPHAGEMAQLLDRERSVIEADPIAAAREASSRFGVVTVLKGSSTCIVDPQGEIWHYDGGSIGLATSGSGDVLAGLIVGLLARGCTPAEGAIWAVYLHGEAGRRLALSQGRLGFLAREIAGEVPAIMDELRPG